MFIHNLPERYSPPVSPSPPTEHLQPASLATLPNKLLTATIEQALPEDIPNKHFVEETPKVAGQRTLKLRSQPIGPHLTNPTDHSYKNRYAILYTNKTLHTTALHILQSRSFHLCLRETAFWTGSAVEITRAPTNT